MATLFPVDVSAAVAQLVSTAPAGVTRHLVAGLTPGAGYAVQSATVAGGAQQQADSGGVLVIKGGAIAVALAFLPLVGR